MGRYYTTASGVTMIIPDSSVDVNVSTNPQGIAQTGVAVLVGEAEEGPHWSQESSLDNVSFGPTDIARVVAKYSSGRLVDAFRGAIAASSSPRIAGSPNRIICIKTNQGVAADKDTDDGHGTITSKRSGSAGNLIVETIATAQDEVAPFVGPFTYMPSLAVASSMAVRLNGGAAQTLAISASTLPDALATAIIGKSNLNATGGVNRGAIAGLAGKTLLFDFVSGVNCTITLEAGQVFAATPVIGDTLQIPAASIIKGAASANVGWYEVTSVSNTVTSAVIGCKAMSVTGAPIDTIAIAISATPANDMLVFSPMSIFNMTGTSRNSVAALIGINATVTVAGADLTFTLAAGSVFAAGCVPKVNDIMYIPSGSSFVGAGSANLGWFQVTAVQNLGASAYIKAARLSNGNPIAVSIAPIVAGDIVVYSRQVHGTSKSMEIYDNGGSVSIATEFLNLGLLTAASWLSVLQFSSAEFEKSFTFTRSTPSTNESIANIGGNISLLVGYVGTSATLTISTAGVTRTLATSVVGGLGGNLSINLNQLATINDLVLQISSNAGYTASVFSSAEGVRSPMILDQVTAVGICSPTGKPCKIKRDIYDMVDAPSGINTSSTLVNYDEILLAGLPDDEGPVMLTGGTKGGTTGLAFSQAIDALAKIRCNFVVPLVSQDHDLDLALGLTEAASSYHVDAVNAAVKSHCILMSTPKVKRHRVAVVSKLDTFANAKAAAETMANFRVGFCFQPVKDLNSNGDIQTFQPWLGAAKAAGMQAAGFYKAIFNKALNISGIDDSQVSGFDSAESSLVEDALMSGMIPIRREEDGSFDFVSDQMTYGTDNNFVYNSLQAVYVADIIALSLAQSLKTAFVGESVADVTVASAISFIKGKMAEFLSKKLTVGTTAAPGGWKSINVSINQGVMTVDCIVVEATAIYYIPIKIDIEGINTSAAA